MSESFAFKGFKRSEGVQGFEGFKVWVPWSIRFRELRAWWRAWGFGGFGCGVDKEIGGTMRVR